MVPRLFNPGASALCALALTCGHRALAADTGIPSPADSGVPVSVRLQNEAIINNEPIRRIYVTAETNLFAFVLPGNCRLDASNPSLVAIIEENNRCFLTLRILAPPKPDSLTPPPSFREAALTRHPGATVLEEFTKHGGGRSGPAFDLQETNSHDLIQRARIAFFSTRAGTLEFTLQSPGDQFDQVSHLFDSLVRSTCTDEAGPIKPMQTPAEPPRS